MEELIARILMALHAEVSLILVRMKDRPWTVTRFARSHSFTNFPVQRRVKQMIFGCSG